MYAKIVKCYAYLVYGGNSFFPEKDSIVVGNVFGNVRILHPPKLFMSTDSGLLHVYIIHLQQGKD